VVDDLGAGLLDDALELTVLPDVATEKRALVEVATVHPPDLVAPPLQLRDQMAADGPAGAGHQNVHRPDSMGEACRFPVAPRI
jgi:hypothetical protein